MKRIHVLLLLFLVVVLLTVAAPWESAFRIRAGRGRAIEEAVADLAARSYDRRERAQARLASLGADAEPALREALRSEDPEVRMRAAAALRAIERDGETLAEIRFRQYRVMIHTGLVRRGSLEPGSVRFTALSVDPETAALAAAAAASDAERDAVAHARAVALLRDLAHPAGAPYLSGLLRRGRFLPSTLHAAAEGLSRIGAVGAVPDLAAAVRDGGPDARRLSLRLLGELGGDAELPLARAAATDPEPRVRTEAPRALRLLGGERAIPAVLDLASDESAAVRAAALPELALLSRAPARRVAIAALGDPDAGVRTAALAALRVRGVAADGALARPLLEDPSPRVRGEAVRAVTALNSSPEAVAEGLRDRSPAVRRIALLSARELPAEVLRDVARRAPEESDPWLRELRSSILGVAGAN